MKKVITFFIIIVLTGSISACRSTTGEGFDWTAAASFDTSTVVGPPEYVQGWRDGCETGRSAYANHFYKMFLTVKQDEQLAQNPVYYQVWKDAYLYCWFYQETTSSHAWGNFDSGGSTMFTAK